MSLAPHLWSRNPVAVSQEFDNRHGAGTLPNSFSWAIWAAEGLDYLEKLDAGHPVGLFRPAVPIQICSTSRTSAGPPGMPSRPSTYARPPWAACSTALPVPRK